MFLSARKIELGLIYSCLFFIIFHVFLTNIENQLGVNTQHPSFKISEELSSYSTYERYFDRVCRVGSLEERHRLRWVSHFLEYNYYAALKSINPVFPFYVMLFTMSSAIFLSYWLCTLVVGLSWKSAFLFFAPTLLIMTGHLSEVRYSFIEMFLISLAIYASHRKRFILFTLAAVIAPLNRESGLLLCLFWPLFNKDIARTVIVLGISLFVFLSFNWDMLGCIVKPGFLVTFQHQEGQTDMAFINEMSTLTIIRVILLNFMLFILPATFLHFRVGKNPPYFIFLFMFYFLVFLIATPLTHMSLRLMIIPLLLVIAHNFEQQESLNS
jgi:hypothetical protein